MVNKVMLIGRLGKDPDFRSTPNGISVARFSLATDEKRKNESGELTSKTEWHNIVMFRRQAEVARDYLRKGALVYVEGKLHYDKYDNKEGQTVYRTEILGDNFQMLDSRSDRGGGDNVDRSTSQERSHAGAAVESNLPGARKDADAMTDDEDLPF